MRKPRTKRKLSGEFPLKLAQPLYSERFEEVLIRSFFEDRREGVFLDVGCASPMKFSTTCYLEKHLGWHGVAVDAEPMQPKRWAQERPATQVFARVVSDVDDSTETFYASGYVGSTQARRKVFKKEVRGTAKELPTITLNTLLERAGCEHIDFMSMDIEESELRALRGFDLQRYKPALICIEKSPSTAEALMDYFSEQGYRRIDDYCLFDSVNWYFTPAKQGKWEAPKASTGLALQEFHNTRHFSRRHASLSRYWTHAALASPWLARFDWVLDVSPDAPFERPPRIELQRNTEVPTTVFVRVGHLNTFAERVLPQLEAPVLLYIGNGGLPLSQAGADIQALFSHPLIHRVFAENKDIDDPRIEAMPIGIHPRQLLWQDGSARLLQIGRSVKPRDKLPGVFGAWTAKRSIGGSRYDRDDARRFMLDHPEICDYQQELSQEDYWRSTARYRFSLCPWGVSYDTSRIFEVLALGSIPIILRSPCAEAYAGLPVVVIDELSDISREAMDLWWHGLGDRLRQRDYLTPDFWWQRVKRAAPAPKRAFLVVGPESHGTHMVTDVLTHAGVQGYSGRHDDWQSGNTSSAPGADDHQPWDTTPPTDEALVVWRRSVPHQTHYPPLGRMSRMLQSRGYQVQWLVMTRDRGPALSSQLRWGHINDIAEGERNIDLAYRHIFNEAAHCGVAYEIVSYESLLAHPEAQTGLLNRLNLPLPDTLFELQDGNAKWYTDTPAPEKKPPAFPEYWFPVASATARGPYRERVETGYQRMAQSKVVIAGLARDLGQRLTRPLQCLERLATLFGKHQIVLFENDSVDETGEQLQTWAGERDTVTLIRESFGHPQWARSRDAERMQAMAGYRNRYLEWCVNHAADAEYLLVVDVDIAAGISLDGVASSFGHDHWDMMAANSLLVAANGAPSQDPSFFDTWAYREPEDESARSSEDLNQLRFWRGEAPVPVGSAFGGLGIYRLSCIRDGARYTGPDCEHVGLHSAMRALGHDRLFLNPDQIVLYSE